MDSEGPVRVLRQILVCHLNAVTMASKQDEVNIKASVSTNLSGVMTQVRPQNNDNNSHAGACAGSNSVFVELMRQVPFVHGRTGSHFTVYRQVR